MVQTQKQNSKPSKGRMKKLLCGVDKTATLDDNVLPYITLQHGESSASAIPSTGTTDGAAATANNMTTAIAMAPHSLLTYNASKGKQQHHISSSSPAFSPETSLQSLERQTSMIQHDVLVRIGNESFTHSSHILSYASPVLANQLQPIDDGENKEGDRQNGEPRIRDDENKQHIEFCLRIPHKDPTEWCQLLQFLEPHSVQSAVLSSRNLPLLLPWFRDLRLTVLLQECDRLLDSMPWPEPLSQQKTATTQQQVQNASPPKSAAALASCIGIDPVTYFDSIGNSANGSVPCVEDLMDLVLLTQIAGWSNYSNDIVCTTSRTTSTLLLPHCHKRCLERLHRYLRRQPALFLNVEDVLKPLCLILLCHNRDDKKNKNDEVRALWDSIVSFLPEDLLTSPYCSPPEQHRKGNSKCANLLSNNLFPFLLREGIQKVVLANARHEKEQRELQDERQLIYSRIRQDCADGNCWDSKEQKEDICGVNFQGTSLGIANAKDLNLCSTTSQEITSEVERLSHFLQSRLQQENISVGGIGTDASWVELQEGIQTWWKSWNIPGDEEENSLSENCKERQQHNKNNDAAPHPHQMAARQRSAWLRAIWIKLQEPRLFGDENDGNNGTATDLQTTAVGAQTNSKKRQEQLQKKTIVTDAVAAAVSFCASPSTATATPSSMTVRAGTTSHNHRQRANAVAFRPPEKAAPINDVDPRTFAC